MKYYNKLSIIALGCLFLASSCSDMDNMVPEGQVVTDDQVNETTTAIPERVAADLAGIYFYMGKVWAALPANERADDFGYPAMALSQDLNGPDMVCDNSGFNWFSVSSSYEDRDATYANPYARYANFYNQLRLVNDLLLSIDPETTNPELQVYIGQAKAVRAFDYLGLAPYFQFNYASSRSEPCVPIVTEETTNFSDNPRATVEEVYALIMSDLDDAIELLNGYERGNDKTKIDQKVAYGLRARANLYMGNWEAAAADAASAMVGYTPAPRESLKTPTFVNISEANWMWGIMIEAANITVSPYATWPSKLSSFSGHGYAAGTGTYKRINPLLYNKIADTDIRKGWWCDEEAYSPLLETVTWNGTTGRELSALSIDNVKFPFSSYTNVKFGMKSGVGSTTNDSDWCLMRVEEMILIRAEALAMSGNPTGGRTELENFVKTYRDPSYTFTSTDATAIQNEVWKQRRIELWGEGFAMSDIMRLRKPVVRIHGNDIGIWPNAFAFNMSPEDGYLLLRFPQRETNNNQAIPTTSNSDGTPPVPMQNSNLRDGVTD